MESFDTVWERGMFRQCPAPDSSVTRLGIDDPLSNAPLTYAELRDHQRTEFSLEDWRVWGPSTQFGRRDRGRGGQPKQNVT